MHFCLYFPHLLLSFIYLAVFGFDDLFKLGELLLALFEFLDLFCEVFYFGVLLIDVRHFETVLKLKGMERKGLALELVVQLAHFLRLVIALPFEALVLEDELLRDRPARDGSRHLYQPLH